MTFVSLYKVPLKFIWTSILNLNFPWYLYFQQEWYLGCRTFQNMCPVSSSTLHILPAVLSYNCSAQGRGSPGSGPGSGPQFSSLCYIRSPCSSRGTRPRRGHRTSGSHTASPSQPRSGIWSFSKYATSDKVDRTNDGNLDARVSSQILYSVALPVMPENL